MAYPLTKMNFLVTVADVGTAAFTEVSGIEATVDMTEFRQGNSGSLSTIKIPGLVKHGNITLKFGYTESNEFTKWVEGWVNPQRAEATVRKNVTIELIDIRQAAPTADITESKGTSAPRLWVLTNAWVAKYSGSDLNATSTEVAFESIELAYEELKFSAA